MSTTLQRRREPADHLATDPLPRDATACPDCGGSVVEGQGLATCTHCRWTGIYA